MIILCYNYLSNSIVPLVLPKAILPPYVMILPYQNKLFPPLTISLPFHWFTLFIFIHHCSPCPALSPPLLEWCLFRLAAPESTVFENGFHGYTGSLIEGDWSKAWSLSKCVLCWCRCSSFHWLCPPSDCKNEHILYSFHPGMRKPGGWTFHVQPLWLDLCTRASCCLHWIYAML